MTEVERPTEPVFEFDSMLRPEFSRAPQPYYKQMRDTNPVLRTDSLFGDSGTMVFVSKHSDIEHAVRNPKVFSSKYAQGMGIDTPMIPLQMDPPEHHRYRRLLDPLFGPKEMNKLEGDVIQKANELIDTFIGRGECDYATEFAVPLPCGVFLRLLGAPLDDIDRFVELKDGIIRGNREMVLTTEDPVRQEAAREVNARFAKLIAERRRHPRDDLITHLVNAAPDGEALTHEELLAICFVLFIAGLDTVTDSLSCFYAFLGRSPDHRRRFVEDPGIIPAAIEEMLRFETPVPLVARITTENTELSGCPIHAGEHVGLVLGSANTDERVHENGDEVDFDRPDIKHLAFGGGIHRCLGSHLARMELRVSLAEWHRRIPEYHIPDDVELEFSPVLRQVEHVPIVFDRVVG